MNRKSQQRPLCLLCVGLVAILGACRKTNIAMKSDPAAEDIRVIRQFWEAYNLHDVGAANKLLSRDFREVFMSDAGSSSRSASDMFAGWAKAFHECPGERMQIKVIRRIKQGEFGVSLNHPSCESATSQEEDMEIEITNGKVRSLGHIGPGMSAGWLLGISQ